MSTPSPLSATQMKPELATSTQEQERDPIEQELHAQRKRLACFTPTEHLMKIGSGEHAKDYLQVQWRLVWFRAAYPHGSIETQEILHDPDRETEEEGYAWNPEKRRSEKITKRGKGYAIFKAIVKDGKGGMATGHKSEKAASFPDYYEKSETGAIGRALAALGYGTQFAPELSEEHRIVDSPVEPIGGRTRRPVTAAGSTPHPDAASPAEKADAPNPASSADTRSGAPVPAAPQTGEPATEKQMESIRKLCVALKKDPPDGSTLTAEAAGQLISALTNEYKAARARAATPATR